MFQVLLQLALLCNIYLALHHTGLVRVDIHTFSLCQPTAGGGNFIISVAIGSQLLVHYVPTTALFTPLSVVNMITDQPPLDYYLRRKVNLFIYFFTFYFFNKVQFGIANPRISL
uniref:Secreted protein n=1 Tax=Panstrongylus lignarius TaxID=156445 RepID=A0A224XPZ0_9HEMI